MDRYEVRDALLAAGLSPDAFEIEGVHRPDPLPPDYWFLRRAGSEGWAVGVYERGVDDVRLRTPSESTACAFLHRALTGT
ncbi:MULTISPECIES: hypothetical protein [Micromonospora]|uniref:Uncharacterized protein n=1 Tax=Micromonospora yangpuensis TaxID=683228 RepID=A0A1C6TYC9_9ACTN|nr:hypothetical protein [Micromonospora yangpuensis]GGM20058.1 hypothetical protein GCM10012279_42990 [Micromonospora yangpuensis]SCL46658.1 hypothetical protein GA0070617_0345 [Micromonospora yangpuensis]